MATVLCPTCSFVPAWEVAADATMMTETCQAWRQSRPRCTRLRGLNLHVIIPHRYEIQICLRDTWAICGLASYYRKFLKDLRESPSRCQLWRRKAKASTGRRKFSLPSSNWNRLFANTVTLAYPQRRRKYVLDTDTSDVAIGAILSTKVEGVERPIAFAFFTRIINVSQRNYCPTRW